MPPEVIYYAETGGKSAPFYRTLGGIKSALKMSWHGRSSWRYRGGSPPRVYAGVISWREIDPETGAPIGDPFPAPPQGVGA
jgi:hypothetical protein